MNDNDDDDDTPPQLGWLQREAEEVCRSVQVPNFKDSNDAWRWFQRFAGEKDRVAFETRLKHSKKRSGDSLSEKPTKKQPCAAQEKPNQLRGSEEDVVIHLVVPNEVVLVPSNHKDDDIRDQAIIIGPREAHPPSSAAVLIPLNYDVVPPPPGEDVPIRVPQQERHEQHRIARRRLLNHPCQRLRACVERLIRLEDEQAIREESFRIMILTSRIAKTKRQILGLSGDGGNQVSDDEDDEHAKEEPDKDGDRLLRATNAFIACDCLRLLPVLHRKVNDTASLLAIVP